MPTSQKVQIDTYDFGASLTNPTLAALGTGTTIANGTANSCNEQTADSGVYIADFVGADSSALIPAGTYRLRTAVNGKPLKRFVTFAGVDGEVVYARSEEHAALNADTQTQLDNIAEAIDALPSFIGGVVVVPSPVITAVGMPETLEIGDSYDEDASLKIYIRDADDNPVSAAVGHDFTDEDFAPTLVIAPTPGSSRGRVKGIVEYVDPGGSDEPYLKVAIPSSQSKLAVAGEASVQLVLKWPGAEKTLLNNTVRWLPRI